MAAQGLPNRSGYKKKPASASRYMRPSRRIPIVPGQVFGKLTVIREDGRNSHGDIMWLCQCECGNTCFCPSSGLRRGNNKSCGCSNGKKYHGQADNRLYSVWCTMKARCTNPNNEKYAIYGGRGISVCNEWMHDFPAFSEWAVSAGYDFDASYGECTLDRIDVNGNYEPDNCRWVDAKTQATNKRPREYRTHGLEIDCFGEHYVSIRELASSYGIDSAKLERRIHRMTAEEALMEIRASIVTDDGRLKSIRYVSNDQWDEVMRLIDSGAKFSAVAERLNMTELLVGRIHAAHRNGRRPYGHPLPMRIVSLGSIGAKAAE